MPSLLKSTAATKSSPGAGTITHAPQDTPGDHKAHKKTTGCNTPPPLRGPWCCWKGFGNEPVPARCCSASSRLPRQAGARLRAAAPSCWPQRLLVPSPRTRAVFAACSFPPCFLNAPWTTRTGHVLGCTGQHVEQQVTALQEAQRSGVPPFPCR